MGVQAADPLIDKAPEEIPLKDAPLVRVLAQVRFSEILSIMKEDFVAGFQERLRQKYPQLNRQDGQIIMITPQGPEVRPDASWRLADTRDQWRLTLSTGAVTLEAAQYTSRRDFAERLREILAAVADTFKPAAATRVGIRYVDRISGQPLTQIDALVRGELIGLAVSPLRDRLERSLSEALCESAEGQLLVRWGWMPPNGSYDPSTVPPIAEKSWLLDIDSFKMCGPDQAFDIDQLNDLAVGLATRAYTFFRWAITDEFIKTYKGAA